MNPFASYEANKNVNYWEVDNQLATIGNFKVLYEKDKSKKKKDSSLFMWAVAFYCHPDSRLLNFSFEDKRNIIENDIAGKELNWKLIEDYCKDYTNLYLTQAKRSLHNWKKKLEERDNYLLSIPYRSLGLQEAAQLDKLLADTPKLFKQYTEIQSMIDEEAAKEINKAGIKESASEKKLL